MRVIPVVIYHFLQHSFGWKYSSLKWLTRLEKQSGTLNSAHSLTHSFTLSIRNISSRLLCPDRHREGHYKVMDGVHLSVCHVSRPNSRMESIWSPKLAGWKPITRVNMWTYLEVKKLLATTSNKRTSNSPGQLMLSQTMHHTQVGGITMFLKLACLNSIRGES